MIGLSKDWISIQFSIKKLAGYTVWIQTLNYYLVIENDRKEGCSRLPAFVRHLCRVKEVVYGIKGLNIETTIISSVFQKQTNRNKANPQGYSFYPKAPITGSKSLNKSYFRSLACFKIFLTH